AIGLGLLSKYGYALFLGAAGAAMLTLPAFRRLLLARGIWLALAVAGAVLLPHILWIALQGIDLARGFDRRLAAPDGASYGSVVAMGLFKLVNGVFVFLVPLVVFAVALFPRAALPLPPAADHER